MPVSFKYVPEDELSFSSELLGLEDERILCFHFTAGLFVVSDRDRLTCWTSSYGGAHHGID